MQCGPIPPHPNALKTEPVDRVWRLLRHAASQRQSTATPVEYWRPVSLVAHKAPTTYLQSIQGQESAKWQIAMDEEMEAIRKNQTRRFTNRPASRRVLKGK